METENPKKQNVLRWTVLLLLVLIWAGMVIYGERTQVAAMLSSMKLIPEPERFTELYFTNPQAIPTSTAAGKPIAFSFTIGNQEGTALTYPYDVSFKYPDGRIIDLINGATIVPANATATIPITYYFPSSTTVISERGEVIVTLPSENKQQIDFFLPYSN